MNRRTFLKWASAFPLLAQVGLEQTAHKSHRKEDKLQIVSMTLRPGEEIIIGQRLRQLLTQARRQAA